jgi:glutamate-1-semialdehyde 2,1-aminomutase
MEFTESHRLRQRAHRLIPGGCHTYAKGDDQYPRLAPGFITAGKGSHVWDVDGNEFIEYGMGLRAVTLGHAFPPVVAAAAAALQQGSNFTRPAPIEVECAEEFLSIIDGAEMVKFAKDGSTVTTAAVRLARAVTGRKRVAICESDPFISYNDWFIRATPMRAGIPTDDDRLTIGFRYNDIDSVRQLFAAYPAEIACVICELERTEAPRGNFLADLYELCHRHGALFIADEMITGFRWHLGGAQKEHGVTPDLSTFGKAMANGFSVSALAGRREIMELGGIDHDRERVFLLSTTHGAETHALAAAQRTMQIYKEKDVIGRLYRQGARLERGVRAAAIDNGVAQHVEVLGRPCNLVYATRDEKREPSQRYRALFLQELIRHGVLAPSFVVSFSHSDEDIDRTLAAVDAALWVYRRALEEGVDRFLVGPPVKPVFRAYC